MQACANNTIPPGTFKPEAGGNAYVGVATFAFGGMSGFCFQILKSAVEMDLKRARISSTPCGNYDNQFAVLLLEVREWRAAAACLDGTLRGLNLSKISAVYRYDSAESFWRKTHGDLTGDFKIISDVINPAFAENERAVIKSVLKILEAHLFKQGKKARAET